MTEYFDDLNIKGLSQEDWRALRYECQHNLYFLAKGILGYKDLTKRVHQDFCEFIQSPHNRKLGLMPRGHFKTTINIADVIRMLLVNPNETILITSESAENAEYMLGEIKGHFEYNEKLQRLFPEIIPKNFNKTNWSRRSITVQRSGVIREPSIDTAGVTSKIVSRHYTVIKADDLISDEAMFSPTVMRKACQFFDRLVSLLVNPLKSHIHIIGTRWAYNDVYSHVLENYKSFEVLVRKAIVRGPDGPEPFFPERYSMEIFQDIIRINPDQWATQYANDPLDTSVAEFKTSWLQYFKMGPDKGIRWTDDDGVLHMQPLETLRIYIHVDPSTGLNPTGDYTGITVVGLNASKQIFILDAWQGRIDPLMQREKILQLATHWKPRLVSIEKNAYQVALRFAVEEEAKRRGLYLPLYDFLAPSNKSKGARILGALQPLFSTRRIWIREGLFEFVEEYMRFGRSDHEHMMDSLAQGPHKDVWKYPQSAESVLLRKVRSEIDLVPAGVTGYGV